MSTNQIYKLLDLKIEETPCRKSLIINVQCYLPLLITITKPAALDSTECFCFVLSHQNRFRTENKFFINIEEDAGPSGKVDV